MNIPLQSHLIPLEWIIIATSLLWKRRVTKAGSWLVKHLKEQAMKQKRRRRKRLGDFLADSMLRQQMLTEFEDAMGIEGAARHMEELELTASRPVTVDDVHVGSRQAVVEAMRRIWLAYSIVVLPYLLSNNQPTAPLVQLSVGLLCHTIDNILNFKSSFGQGIWLVSWASAQYLTCFIHMQSPTVLKRLLLWALASFSLALYRADSHRPTTEAPSPRGGHRKHLMEV
jgi:hypothetical protein